MSRETSESPADLRGLSYAELDELADEIRAFVVQAVLRTGGHLGSNLGVVELTLAVHRVFESPRDIIVWDTGHQAYIHKILTGRRGRFPTLRQAGGLSGYPSRRESEHDWVENSHASTALSYAHGLATAVEQTGADRRVVAVVGDGAMTGGMAFEALNNLGHSGTRVVIILNDNGRSYAPTVSRLSESLTRLRLNPSYVSTRTWLEQLLRELPAVGGLAQAGLQGIRAALREVLEPRDFFAALGVRHVGPLDGHDIAGMEQALRDAAAGMARGGLRPVVAVYSTFLSRALDQANLDVGLHGLPVVFALDRAGITGDDGPSHHGVLDLALTLKIPGMTVFAPSSAQEVGVMLRDALDLDGPAAIRWPKTPARQVTVEQVGSGLKARRAH